MWKFVIVLIATACMALAAPDGAVARSSDGASMPLSEFLRRANRIPRNPLALVSPDAHRLRSVFQDALGAVAREERANREAGRPSRICLPDRISVNAEALLERFNAIPASRRNITVADAVRDWLAEEHPCQA